MGRGITKVFILYSLLIFLILLFVKSVIANDRINAPLDNFAVEVIKTNGSVKIDGTLDEDCWKQAQSITNFTQWMPNQEKQASEKTVCYISYDEYNLYFAGICYESNPDKITANIDNRDAILGDDWVMLILDSYNDMQSAYEFLVNPLGIQADLIQFGDHDDTDWDAVWRSKGIITENGWQFEMAIPFESVRFSPKENQVWRFQVFRKIAYKGEMACYVPFRKNDNNALSRTATLTGLKNISRNQTLTLLPYTAAKHEKQDLAQKDWNIGGDIKYVFKSNIVLDMTVNPDYGQVEADIDQIDLTPYELYLQEKRPFFLEKMDAFETPFGLFYSRRISNPLVGFKATGKLGKYSFGAVYALNDNENDLNNDNFFITRVQRNISSQSKVGLMITDKEGDGQYNRVMAGDWKIINGSFIFKGQLAKSWTNNVSRLTWLGYNSIVFMRNNFQLNYSYKFAESNFMSQTGYVTPTYIDITFQPVSYRKNLLGVSYKWQINNGWVRNINSSTNFSVVNSYEGGIMNKGVWANITAEFDANITTSISLNQNRQLWEGNQHNINNYSLYVSGNPSKYFTAGFYFSEGKALDYWNAVTVWQKYLSFSLELKPTSRIEISPSINHASQYLKRGGEKTFDQWVGLIQMAYNHSSDLFFKLFLQGNDLSDHYTCNFLVGYTFLPGSTFYLAYNSEYLHVNEKFEPEKRILFAKISLLTSI